MWLLAGLGNPGASYAHNRHNIGFMAVEAIASHYHFPPASQKFGGLLSDGRIGNERALLFEPLSFMNNSGQPVGELMRFYKIPPEKLIAFHDELDLPLGKLRVKAGGGNGGHNGLKSIDAHVGPPASAAPEHNKGYWRVRLGIGHPGEKEKVTGHVLSDFSKAEQKIVGAWLATVAEHLPLLLEGDEAKFMNKIALVTQQKE